MNFLCPSLADHAHDFTAGGAAYNRVIDQYDSLAFQHAANRIQLQLHSEIAHVLLRFDEGPTHVVIANQPETEGNPALAGVAHGGADTRVGHRHDNVCVRWRFPGQGAAQHLAADLHRPAEYQAVGPREIHVL